MKRRVASYARKIIITAIGVPIIIVGIILIPLPGPGLLIVFAGLFVLSLEFEWAERYRDQAQAKLKKIISQSRERADKINKR